MIDKAWARTEAVGANVQISSRLLQCYESRTWNMQPVAQLRLHKNLELSRSMDHNKAPIRLSLPSSLFGVRTCNATIAGNTQTTNQATRQTNQRTNQSPNQTNSTKPSNQNQLNQNWSTQPSSTIQPKSSLRKTNQSPATVAALGTAHRPTEDFVNIPWIPVQPGHCQEHQQ